MALNEEKKTGKIVDELVLYLLRRGHSDIGIKIEYKKKLKTIITIEIEKCKEDIKCYMLKYINQEREYEVEEYGWEIMGESDQSNELEMIGLLVDSLEATEENGKTILKLVRNHRR